MVTDRLVRGAPRLLLGLGVRNGMAHAEAAHAYLTKHDRGHITERRVCRHGMRAIMNDMETKATHVHTSLMSAM